MKSLNEFLENQADELLENSDLVCLSGGDEDKSDSVNNNAFANCGTTNNCHGGNCAAQCGCSKTGVGNGVE